MKNMTPEKYDALERLKVILATVELLGKEAMDIVDEYFPDNADAVSKYLEMGEFYLEDNVNTNNQWQHPKRFRLN